MAVRTPGTRTTSSALLEGEASPHLALSPLRSDADAASNNAARSPLPPLSLTLVPAVLAGPRLPRLGPPKFVRPSPDALVALCSASTGREAWLNDEVISVVGRLAYLRSHGKCQCVPSLTSGLYARLRVEPDGLSEFEGGPAKHAALAEIRRHSSVWANANSAVILLFPMQVQAHWILVIADSRRRRIEVWDSSLDTPHYTLGTAHLHVSELTGLLTAPWWKDCHRWSGINMRPSEGRGPAQLDDASCGVFVAARMLEVASGAASSFTQQSVPFLRAALYQVILNDPDLKHPAPNVFPPWRTTTQATTPTIEIQLAQRLPTPTRSKLDVTPLADPFAAWALLCQVAEESRKALEAQAERRESPAATLTKHNRIVDAVRCAPCALSATPSPSPEGRSATWIRAAIDFAAAEHAAVRQIDARASICPPADTATQIKKAVRDLRRPLLRGQDAHGCLVWEEAATTPRAQPELPPALPPLLNVLPRRP